MAAIDQYAPGQYAVQGADGNWVSYGGDQGAAERAYNTAMGYSNTPAAPSYSTGSFATGGGYGYLPGALDAAQAAAQQQYLRDRLNNLEIPMSQAERQQLIAQMTGYYASPTSASMTDEQALDYIWQTKPDLANFFRANGWAVDTPEQQRAAARNWVESVDPANRGKTVQEVAQGLGAQMGGGFTGSGPGGTPTFQREQWNAANNQWTANFLGSKSGPQSYALYSQLQPTAAFGQVQGSPSWEQALASFWNGTPAAQTGGAQTSGVAYRQPASFTAGELNTMTPTQQAMRGSEWSYNGLDPNDMWTMANKARPTGQAALNTMWR